MRNYLPSLFMALVVASCVDPGTVECFGNLCPVGTVCIQELERCVDQERVAACTGAGLLDGDACSAGGQPGVCAAGICGSGCGDGLALEDEVCDSADFGALTCLDFDFYEGELGCSTTCDGVDTSSCQGFCGDGQVNGPELCDPDLERNVDCYVVGFDRGASQCELSCSWPTYGCGMNGLKPVPGLLPPGDAWAVHGFAPGRLLLGSNSGTLMHVEGERFELESTPAKAGIVPWALDEENIFAISFDAEIVQKKDGAWILHESPVPILGGIRGLDANRVWAVGGQDVIAFDGSTWQMIPTPDPDMDPDTPWTAELYEVTPNEGANGVQLWIGGLNFFTTEPPLHLYEGGTWTTFDDPEFMAVGEYGGLTVSDIYAAGPADVYVAFKTLFPSYPALGKLVHFHYDGADWGYEVVASGHDFLSVAGTGPNNIFATSTAIDIYTFYRYLDLFLSQLWHFDGSEWSVIDYNTLSAEHLSVIGGAVHAVEADSAEGFPNIRRYDGTSWLERAEGADLGEFCVDTYVPVEPDCGFFTKNPFCLPVCEPTSQGHATGAALSAPGELVVVSDAVDGSYTIPFLWSYSLDSGYAEIPFPGGSPVPLKDAFTPDRGQTVFAVGDQGVALVRSGGSWTRYDTTGGNDLRAVHGRAANDVYAVGVGTVLHFTGAGWAEVYDAGATVLESVWVAPDGVVYVGGANCTLLSNAGGAWQAISPAPPCHDATSRIVGVYATSAADIYASDLGPPGSQLRHFDGTEWTRRGNPVADPTPQYTKWFETGDGVTHIGNGLASILGGRFSEVRFPSSNISADSGGITGDDRSIYFVQSDGAVWEMLRLWPWQCESNETECADGMDNDCDGQFDTDDADCPAP